MKFWNYEIDGKMQEVQAACQCDAQKCADDDWYDTICDSGTCGELDNEIFLIELTEQPDGNFIETARVKSSVSYEPYHGDFAEHNVWNKAQTGVV